MAQKNRSPTFSGCITSVLFLSLETIVQKLEMIRIVIYSLSPRNIKRCCQGHHQGVKIIYH